MGKADIYVFLIVVVLAALVAAGWGLMRLGQRVTARAHVRHVAKLAEATPWTQFTDVGDDGECVIGAHRRAEGHTFAKVVMARLPVDTPPVDIELKVNEARDRAAVFNLRDNNELS